MELAFTIVKKKMLYYYTFGHLIILIIPIILYHTPFKENS